MRRLFASVFLLAGCSPSIDSGVAPSADTGGGDTATTDTGTDTGKDTGGDTATCTAPQTKCGAACVDTKTDAKNCGGCGKPCSSGQTCDAGVCKCSASSTKCGTECVDTMVDAKHCGGCGKACSAPATCESGICITPCPSGTTKCSGKCVDTKTDAANCGACDKACPSGQSCVDGACALTCDAPLLKCADKCVNPGFDADHCGGCGKKCPSGAKATAACTSGSCLLLCDAGYGDCNDKGDDGCEVTLATDKAHCGKCGNACGPTDTCSGGECKCSGGGTKCPDGKCADLATDTAHCGSCTTACGANMVCSSGACVCKTGWVLCGDTCYETKCPPTGFPSSALITSTDSTLIAGWTGISAIWTKCYAKSTSGASASTFHSLCDGKGPSVVVAKLSTGKIIGAFASKSWTSSGGWMGDSSTFLFSLTNAFKHDFITTSTATYTQYSNSSYGPTFGGGHDWYVPSNMGSSTGGYCYMGYTFKCRIGKDGGAETTCVNDFCGNYSSWTIDELEVWVK